MPFSKLTGNDLAKEALIRMASLDQVPSTLLFSGFDGVGKSLFALALSELLMGSKHAPKIASQNHPDLHILRPEGKSVTHSIENIRKLIDEVALPPYEAPVKVFLIHDANKMLPTSSNALLKTLEEPTPHCYFILLTDSLDSMLPTIVSRCRKVPFFPILQSQIEMLLKQQWGKTSEEARRIAFLSHGSLAKAKALTSDATFPWRPHLLELLSLDLPRDYPQFMKAALALEESCSPEKDGEEEAESPLVQYDVILEEIVAWQRDRQLLKEGMAPEYLYHLDSLEPLKLSLTQPVPSLEKVLEQVAESRLALQRHVKLRTVLEHFFLCLN